MNDIKIKNDEIQNKYNNWRYDIQQENKYQEQYGVSSSAYQIWDCVDSEARKDFSTFAKLDDSITFEEMLLLEINYIEPDKEEIKNPQLAKI